MSNIFLVIAIVGTLLLIFILTFTLNGKYKSDSDVRGFKGNCESCGQTSCAFHPEHKEEEDIDE